MGHSHLDISSQEGVTVIRLNRPPVNAINTAFTQQLSTAFDACASDGAVRAIVISSAVPGIFSGGADIRELHGLDQAGCKIFVERGQALFDRIEGLPKPVIAAINGACVGGGAELAMACDLRVAGHSARFGQPEVNLGVVPGWGGTQRLPRLVGKTRSMEMLMLGETVPAEAALSMGLVNQVVTDEEVLSTAIALARKLLGKSPIALSAVKRAVQQGLGQSLAEGLKVEAECYLKAYGSGDSQEGIRAFLEKRAPRFTDA